MNEFYEVLNKNDGQNMHLRLCIDAKIAIGINIFRFSHFYKWKYAIWDKNTERIYENVIIKEGEFVVEYETPTRNLTNEFHTFIKQLKQHPSYRLKVINMLNEEIRPIWNAV